MKARFNQMSKAAIFARYENQRTTRSRLDVDGYSRTAGLYQEKLQQAAGTGKPSPG